MTSLNKQEAYIIGQLDRKLAADRAAKNRIRRAAERAKRAKSHAIIFQGEEPLEDMKALRVACTDQIHALRPDGPIAIKSVREAQKVDAERLFTPSREREAA